MADEEAAGPVLAEAPQRVLVLVDTVTPSPAVSCSATDEPTRPHPITIAFTLGRYSGTARSPPTPVHDRLGEGDDQDLARRLAEHEVDRRREEARLPPPARRRAEDDQVGVDLVGLLDDRPADRAGADGRSARRTAFWAEELRLRERGSARSSCASIARRGRLERDADHVERLDPFALSPA